MSDEMQADVPLVYLGPCTLESGKKGELWAFSAAARAAKDTTALHLCASPFTKGRQRYSIGEIWVGPAAMDEAGKPTRFDRSRRFDGFVSTDAIAALRLADEGRKQTEAKERRAGPASELLDEIARIVAAQPAGIQHLVIEGFAAEIRRRSHDIWLAEMRSKK
jgi:hypothetical protein